MSLSAIGTDNRTYAMILFFAVSLLNYLDRTILSVLQVPIKGELGLSDTQMGAATGLAFALFYSTAGLPIGRLSDRAVRKVVIAIAVVTWSTMTALTGLVTSFVGLILLRIGVAVGEAGCVPALHSLVSDFFPRDRRATALSLLGLASPLGMMAGFAGGGWLAHSIGWRQSFLFLGLVGIALAPVLLLTLREPERGRHDQSADSELPTARETIAHLWRLRSFRYIVVAGGLTAYVQQAMVVWNAPFYARAFEMSLRDVALWLALMHGIGGVVGTYAGGYLADAFGRRNSRGYLLVPAAGIAIVIPAMLIQYLTGSRDMSLVLGFVSSACVVAYFAPIVSASHMLVLPRMRALTSATIVLVVNLVGVGLGPTVTGMLSDWYASSPGASGVSLRYAIVSAAPVGVAAVFCWWRASIAFVKDCRPI